MASQPSRLLGHLLIGLRFASIPLLATAHERKCRCARTGEDCTYERQNADGADGCGCSGLVVRGLGNLRCVRVVDDDALSRVVDVLMGRRKVGIATLNWTISRGTNLPF